MYAQRSLYVGVGQRQGKHALPLWVWLGVKSLTKFGLSLLVFAY